MKRLQLSFFCTILFLLAFAASAQDSKKIKSLDNMIQQGMKDWQVPGLAALVVKDGKVVFQKAYGVRDLQSNSPVNENTLFTMASITKAVVGIAMGILVD